MSLNRFKINASKLQKTAQRLIKHFDPKAKLKVETSQDRCLINVKTQMSALLIGRHGETLEALQYLLRLILAKDVEEFVPLILDIADYRASRQKELEELALKLADKVKKFGGSEMLPTMSAYERRLIHLILQDIEGIEEASEGEEPHRRIVIRPKKK